MNDLDPDIDAYGGKARVSALADFTELWSLAGYKPTLEQSVDYAADNNWLPKLEELYEDKTDHPEEDEDGNESSGSLADKRSLLHERLQALVQERIDTLGEDYPFALKGSRLECIKADPKNAYLVLLCLTIAHAYSVTLPAGVVATSVFEDTVSRVVSQKLRAVNLSRVRSSCASLEEAIVRAGKTIGLSPTPWRGLRSKKAYDEKVDCLGHLDWGDKRVGQWVFIGQATCAKSEEWDRKLNEPSTSDWAGFLGLVFDPQAFLAIPHHAEPRFFQKLVASRGRAILDRLRLALWMTESTLEEQSVATAVLGLKLAPLV